MLPKDPIILLSTLNMKLRDQYKSLMDLCDDLDEDELEILNIMNKAGYKYDPNQNQFK